MIIQNFFGGIGNQLFQYAAAYSLSLKSKKILFYDYSLKDTFKKKHISNISDVFDIDINNVVPTYNFFGPLHNLFKRLFLKFLFLSKLPLFFLTENNYKIVLNRKLNKIVMLGYWQDINFFNKHETNLKRQLKFKNFRKNFKILNLIKNSNSIFIHFRQGDYLNKSNKVNYSLPIDYYCKAIDFMKKKVKRPFFFIFSDDINSISKVFFEKKIFNEKFKILKNNHDYEDLFYMTNCKHSIISNSTFAWWGAWLNHNKKKIVIYPNLWFKNFKKSPDIFSKSWIKL